MKDKEKVGKIEQKGKVEQDALVLLGTKVEKYRAEMFNVCAKVLGFDTGYMLLQVMVDCILRFAGQWENASRELIDVMYMFDGFRTWKAYARMSAAKVEKEVLAAVYLIREKDKAVHPYAEMVRASELGALGGFESTTNRNDILNAIFKACDPATLRRLVKEMKLRKVYTISGVINSILDELEGTDREDYIRELFSDNERDEVGGGSAIARPDMKNRNRRRNLKKVEVRGLFDDHGREAAMPGHNHGRETPMPGHEDNHGRETSMPEHKGE